MDELSVSVITPSFNQGSFIETTIQSVLGQNIPGLEYIVVDGGSTDETVSILKKYQERLRWVSEKDEGQADAVNKGINVTSGDIIGWLNADDIYYPGVIEKIRHYFAAHPSVDVVYGDAWEIDSGGGIIGKYLTEPWDLQRLFNHCFISQPAVFFRRRVPARYGLLDRKLHFCMDYEYWLRLGLKGANIAYLPQVLAAMRIHSDAKSSRGFLQAHYEAINMLQGKLGHIPPEWIVNYSSAKVKTESGRKFPNPVFIYSVWMNLWKTAGLHNQGLARIAVWLGAQQVMLKKVFGRMFVLDT